MARPLKIGVVCISSYHTRLQAKFHESIVDLMMPSKTEKESQCNSVPVSVAYSDNTLYLAPSNNLLLSKCNDNHGGGGNNKHLLKPFEAVLQRPPACPFVDMKKANFTIPLDDNKSIQVASVALLESSDHMILLTKRPAFMRTFPNVWVPPGGGVELDEGLFEAALRELKEETSITDVTLVSSQILGLWESGFPLAFSPDQPPRRHHIVSYVHLKTASTALQLNSQLKLQPNEVDRAVWVCPCVAQQIVRSDDNLESSKVQKYFTENACFSPNCLCMSGSIASTKSYGAYYNSTANDTVVDDIPIQPLLTKYSVSTAAMERVSTGTKFALLLWLETLLFNKDR